MPEPMLTQTRDAPSYKVFADGHELPDEIAVDILEVQVCQYVESASTFAIKFNNWQSDRQEFKGVGDERLKQGTEIEVKIGFVDNQKSLIVGEVTALEPEFIPNEAPTMKIYGYDRLHRFRRGRKTRTFTRMKDSQIAEQIARKLNLRSQVDDTQIVHDYVLQANKTDIDFLLDRARRIRYEVTVQDETLRFRKAANDQNKVVTLNYGQTLKSFYPRLSTMQQVSEVIVQGWDPKTKQPIIGRSRQGDENSRMSGANLGVAITERAFFNTTRGFVDIPVFSDSEANQIAKGKFNDMAIAFITGEGEAIGNTDICAGCVIELAGLGRLFSGLYYVTSSKQMVDQKGYITKFTVSRNAA
jgi:phage protein D